MGDIVNLMKAVGPHADSFLIVVGVIALFVWRDKFLNSAAPVPPAQSKDMLIQFLTAYEKSVQIQAQMAMTIERLARGQEKQNEVLNEGLGRVHERIDDFLRNGGIKHAS